MTTTDPHVTQDAPEELTFPGKPHKPGLAGAYEDAERLKKAWYLEKANAIAENFFEKTGQNAASLTTKVSEAMKGWRQPLIDSVLLGIADTVPYAQLVTRPYILYTAWQDLREAQARKNSPEDRGNLIRRAVAKAVIALTPLPGMAGFAPAINKVFEVQPRPITPKVPMPAAVR